mgnify:FL=1
MRKKLPITRRGETTKIEVYAAAPLDIYITVNCYEGTRTPGEVFAKIGNAEVAWLDQWCRAVSVLLQRGETIEKLVELFGYTRFEPAGATSCPAVKICTSLVDLVVRYMADKYGVKV